MLPPSPQRYSDVCGHVRGLLSLQIAAPATTGETFQHFKQIFIYLYTSLPGWRDARTHAGAAEMTRRQQGACARVHDLEGALGVIENIKSHLLTCNHL